MDEFYCIFFYLIVYRGIMKVMNSDKHKGIIGKEGVFVFYAV